MGLLNRKLTCFYCNTRSAQKWTPSVRQFQCKHCDSVNHLDQNGEITDPPASETTQSARFAQPLRPTSPDLNPAESSLFCAKCQKNQHLYTQSLAQYLPPVTDPNYAQYEQKLPEYKKNLEERYPQVCVACAPRVQDRIRKAGYAAKTDHLRRMMERMRNPAKYKRRRGPLTFKAIIVWFAGLAWWTSMVLNVVWHGLGALTAEEQHEDRLDVYAPHGGACFVQAARFKEVEWECVGELGQKEMKTVLLLAALSFWWDSNLAAKLAGSTGRLVNIKDHLSFQLLLFGFRVASWWVLQSPRQDWFTIESYKAAHMVMGVVILMTALVSTRIVKLDHTPRISFHETHSPLLPLPTDGSQPQQRPTTPGYSLYTNPSNTAPPPTQSPAYLAPFPVNKLAQPLHIPSANQQPAYQDPPSPTYSTTSAYTTTTGTTTRRPSTFSTHTTTTPDEDDDPDGAMDWTPTRNTTLNVFSLQSRQPPPSPQKQPLNTGRSPFSSYDRVPAAPRHPYHKARNPTPSQPAFRKAPEYKQKDFFNRIMGKGGASAEGNGAGAGAAVEDEYGDDGDDGAFSMGMGGLGLGPEGNRKGELPLAPGRMKLQAEPQDTGLEGMFNAVFSIRDEPAEVRNAQPQPLENGNAADGAPGGGRHTRAGGSGPGPFGFGFRSVDGHGHGETDDGVSVGVVGAEEGSSGWVVVALPFAGLGVFWALNGIWTLVAG